MKGPFPNEAMRRVERNIDTALADKRLEEAYQTWTAVRTMSEEAIRPEQFADLYGPENVAADLRAVADLQQRFREAASPETERAKRAATVFEAVVYQESELSNWFGEHAQTIKTSEYDDVKNAVDLVVEFDEPGRAPGHVALAVDVSFSAEAVQKKFERIAREIDHDQAGKIKYFVSEQTGIRGELSRVPRIVVGVERGVVAELAGLELGNRRGELAAHPVQRAIVEQVLSQLHSFAEYAKRENKIVSEKTYRRAHDLVRRMLAEKLAVPLGSLADDRVFQMIQQQAATLPRRRDDKRGRSGPGRPGSIRTWRA